MLPNTRPVTTETLLELLADPQRRTVLRHLRETGECDVAELIEAIATDGGTTASHRPSHETVSAVELHHSHLPRLADAGIVEYDRTAGVVRYRGTDRLEALLRAVSRHVESPNQDR